MIVLKEPSAIIWHKLYAGTSFLAARIVLHFGIGDKVSLSELRTACLAVTKTLHSEFPTERIDRLGTHTIQTDGLLEGLGVILTARIEQRHRLHHLAQWYATTIITHTHNLARIARFIGIRTHTDLYHLAFIHAELIDRVIDGFLD